MISVKYFNKNILALATLLLFCLVIKANADANTKVHAKPAQRVITLAPHAFELVYSLGAGDRIVATAEYSDFPKNAATVPRIGGYNGLQIEKILALKPDLVIAWESGNREQEIKRLESLGINVYRSHPATLEDIYHDLLAIGQQLGLDRKAEQLALKFRNDIQNIENKYANKRQPRIFYQMWHQPLRTINEKSWIGQFVKRCGGKNIFADALSEYPVVEPEAVIARNPEAILMTGGKTDNKNIWLQWKQVSAVKNHQFYFLPADPLHRATLRAVEGLRSVCEVIDRVRSQPSAP